jgi:hypothetical protein
LTSLPRISPQTFGGAKRNVLSAAPRRDFATRTEHLEQRNTVEHQRNTAEQSTCSATRGCDTDTPICTAWGSICTAWGSICTAWGASARRGEHECVGARLESEQAARVAGCPRRPGRASARCVCTCSRPNGSLRHLTNAYRKVRKGSGLLAREAIEKVDNSRNGQVLARFACGLRWPSFDDNRPQGPAGRVDFSPKSFDQIVGVCPPPSFGQVP